MCAGSVAAWAQPAGSSDLLATRILELRRAYENVVSQIVGKEAELQDLLARKLRLEGGIIELERYRDEMTPAIPIGELFPTTERDLEQSDDGVAPPEPESTE